MLSVAPQSQPACLLACSLACTACGITVDASRRTKAGSLGTIEDKNYSMHAGMFPLRSRNVPMPCLRNIDQLSDCRERGIPRKRSCDALVTSSRYHCKRMPLRQGGGTKCNRNSEQPKLKISPSLLFHNRVDSWLALKESLPA
eukprot:TRINITY_DN17378_c0_g2_i1.p1 TRINITY_DN17378_c0_g2~~TRINITY_DN17378_c0_g2_i1.p1  ORF type:complete len:143 (+),score=10.75 TRINITY_DN17378_c0_g2_i1:114-542(+)